MRTFSILLIILLSTFTVKAQDITGQWNGVLKVQGTQLRLVFNVTKSDNTFSASMDSPDQGAKGIPVTKTTFENSRIKFEIANAGIAYEGELSENEIIGTFKQAGQEFPMNLSRKAIDKEVVKRPQEPSKPYSYYSEDITFENPKASISLAGTLTLPKKEGVFPVVILISGSGPQNRDEELLGHKPFLVLSDYLTKNGIAVLRYDDRGVGKSKGNFKTATSADFATDVESAISYLKTRKEINKKQIGLIGHSEGGLIAPMVASKSKDVSFIVLLAGTGIQGDQLLLLQQALIASANGATETDIKKTIQNNKVLFEMVVNSNDNQKLKTALTNQINELLKNDTTAKIPNGMTKKTYVSLQVDQITSPWMQYFLKYNPAPALEKVRCPVLALNGEKDLQVPPKENLTAIKNALTKGGNKNATTIELAGLNHLFQESKTGSPADYATIEQTFSPTALEEITKWIKVQTK
ncbi:alpha/beta hydrolase family protein [Flavobacterium hiemivividum]|uniref:Alpha/beta fold hydrolase n=1 Tax=Flavobacterium hiemivividum TaxID=2541734 RepID=A0A4R5CQI3_9FLAO|nr:alpha/beta fold hydrolase [Flavobacterium hiemivividum]TDE01717.1 alpha/beta fold hydrolase [Flavobacterium hiemivividum]